VKRFLNWNDLYREDYNQRRTSLRCVRDEFLRFFQVYGAVWTSFNYLGDLRWRNLALRNGKPVTMIIRDNLFFVPCLLPEQRSERKEEFYRVLADAVVICVRRLRVKLPPWADEYLLPSEKTVLEEQALSNTKAQSMLSGKLKSGFRRRTETLAA
jgi:hypothetical protein